MKTSFKTRVSRMGFCEYQYFCKVMLFFQFLYSLHFFQSLKSKFTQIVRPQKGNSGVSFNDTLLNFGLCSFVLYNLNCILVGWLNWCELMWMCQYKWNKIQLEAFSSNSFVAWKLLNISRSNTKYSFSKRAVLFKRN